MPKLNSNLIRSVAWDLTTVSGVAGEIMSRIGNTDALSWRYPTARCDTVDIPTLLQHRTRSPCEYYILLLELTYDRFHFLFHLLIKFLDMVPAMNEEYALPSYVVRPQHQTLGSLVSTFWQRILFMRDLLFKQAIESHFCIQNRTKSELQELNTLCDITSRGSQTESHSLQACESCHFCEEAVKEMILIIENFGNDLKIPTLVSTQRSQMKEEMFKISQWGAMHRWTNAITEDFTKFITKFKDINTKSRSFKKIIDTNEQKYNKDVKQYISKIKELEGTEKYLRSKIRNGEATEANAEKRIKELEIKGILQKTTIEQLKKELQDLGTRKNKWEFEKEKLLTSLNVAKEETAIFRYESEDLKDQCCTLTEKLNAAEECKNSLDLKLADIKKLLEDQENTFKSEQQDFIKQLEDLGETNSNQSNEIENLNRLITELKAEKLTLEETINDQQCTLNKLREKEQTYEKQKMLLIEYPDLNGPVHQRPVKGNPYEDMKDQLEANKLRIQLLQEQNFKLEKTLDKMSKLSTFKGDSVNASS